MAARQKCKSVLQLAKYKPGEWAYWIITRPVGRPLETSEDDMWMYSTSIHPKTPYKYGLMRNVWPNRAVLPRLHAGDFTLVMELLTSELVVEQFDIVRVVRCPDTGEFIYLNQTGQEWMPESQLFDSAQAAQRERNRIKGLIARWASNIPKDPV